MFEYEVKISGLCNTDTFEEIINITGRRYFLWSQDQF